MFALFIAYILNNKIRGLNFFRTIYYIPSILGGSVSIAVLWKFLFKTEGLVNIMLGALGIPAFNWLGNPDGAFFVIVLLRVWQFGSPMVIFLAALKGVQGDLYEAAAIDGCSPAGTFFKIVVPISKTVYATVFILDFVAHWNDFMWPFLVMTGEDKRTIQLAVQSFFGTQPVHYSAIMAALVVSAIPMIIMLSLIHI